MSAAASDSRYGFEAVWPAAPRLYLDPISTNAAQILRGFPVETVDSGAEADLLWIRKDPAVWYDALQPLQALNHIPREYAMVRKADLAAHLHRYEASGAARGLSHSDFLPSTYCLNDPEERAAFVAQLPAEDHPENLWILKPSNLAEGRGHQIVWKFDWLRKELSGHRRIAFKYAGRELEYVIQRYVKDMLLLDARKSELRMYWLIASLDPLLVLMYPEGFVRLTSKPFKLADFGDALIHITNATQQHSHGGEEVRDVELKWDFTRLQSC